MALRVTALSENTAGMGDFLGEWGLSLLLETDSKTVLMDAGTSISAVHNADSLDVDLKKIDKIVLSHGHYDHTGGLRELLRRLGREIEIIAHPDIWQDKYSRREGKAEKYIGIPYRREELESLGARFNLTAKPVEITDGFWTSGEVPMVTDYEAVDRFLFVKEGTALKPDPVMDDQAIFIRTGQGLVIILGCAHRGMINTIYHAQKTTGVPEIYAVIGGSHLIGASEERVWQSIAALRQLGVSKLGLCHCTDLPVISTLAQEFAGQFIFVKSGTRIDFE